MSPWPPPDDAPLRIVFMGSPGIARPCIDRLIGGPEQVVAIYCQPDKRAGRGRKLTPPPIAHCAAENAIPLYQPRGLRKPEEQERFASLKPDFAVVVAYGKILPPAILAIPRYGCINVHFSLLPAYRGAGPVQWAIIRGERETGVTTMQMDEGLDTGPALLQRSEPIHATDTSASLADRLAGVGADLLAETLAAFRDGTLEARPQDDAASSYAPMLSKADGALDWTRPAADLDQLARGTYPWPGAFTHRAGKRIKVITAEPLKASARATPGQVVRAGKEGVDVACGDGQLRLLQLQPEGKRAMDAASFVNGFRVQPGEQWGEPT
ncbi:MAG: methionyl-tRNA formyltransferase [Myxococcota bacterium]|nr:methionyl-tRNA formyltransferase [Myxococcota bacterium]